jgi:hypothetical protein
MIRIRGSHGDLDGFGSKEKTDWAAFFANGLILLFEKWEGVWHTACLIERKAWWNF